MAADDHQFDRRVSDVNVEALSLLVRGLTGRVETLEEQGRRAAPELAKNTQMTGEVHEAVFGVEGQFTGLATMTRDVHTAVFGDGDKPGVQQLVQNISEVMETARGFFRGIGRMAGGVGKASDFVSRSIRRFWWVIALGIAVATYLKTGKWELPVWPG